MKDLIDIKYWIFDLDNTLYTGQTKVFAEVSKNMSAYISKKLDIDLIKAKELQRKYFYENNLFVTLLPFSNRHLIFVK